MKLTASVTLHQRLATLAIALGLLAAFSGAREDKHTVNVDLGALAAAVQKTDDHISATELADWILQGDSGYRLVDLRTEAEYATYHIPGAENLPLATLLDSSLLRNERIVLYSEGGIHAAQAWLLLQAAGYRSVYSLLGGMEAWHDDVLYPEEPANGGDDEQQTFAKAVEVARAFGGHAVARRQAGSAADDPDAMSNPPNKPSAVVAPAVPVPSTPATATKPRKKKEGC